MESAILILVALFLGYSQGIKRKRKTEGKEGGVFRHVKEKLSRKWQIIREQDEEIWNLKEKINELKKNQEIKNTVVYSKGNDETFEKELFSFMWNNPMKIEKGIGCYLYLQILNENMPEVKEQKYTDYVYKEVFEKLNNIVELDFVKTLTVKSKVFSFDFETIEKNANAFISEFNNFNFDITFKQVENSLKLITEILL